MEEYREYLDWLDEDNDTPVMAYVFLCAVSFWMGASPVLVYWALHQMGMV